RRRLRAAVGLAYAEMRRGRLRASGQALRIAERAAEGPLQEASVLAARGFWHFEYGRLGDAQEAADAAIEKDATSAEGHFLRAMIADSRGDEPAEHLRAAVAGRRPTPEMVGQLVIHGGSSDDRCALAARYLAAAPDGVDARDVRRVRDRCE
ncbi:MAG: hypothetical protein AAF645_01345, partial [Myxococcota bacterium]